MQATLLGQWLVWISINYLSFIIQGNKHPGYMRLIYDLISAAVLLNQ